MNEECCSKEFSFCSPKWCLFDLIHLRTAITCIVKYSLEFILFFQKKIKEKKTVFEEHLDFTFFMMTYDSFIQLVLLPCLIGPWTPSNRSKGVWTLNIFSKYAIAKKIKNKKTKQWKKTNSEKMQWKLKRSAQGFSMTSNRPQKNVHTFQANPLFEQNRKKKKTTSHKRILVFATDGKLKWEKEIF